MKKATSKCYDTKSTAWLHQNIVSVKKNDWEVVLAVVVYRWYNSVYVGECIKHLLLDIWPLSSMIDVLKTIPDPEVYYRRIIPGLDKQQCSLLFVTRFFTDWPAIRYELMSKHSLQEYWEFFCRMEFIMPDLAYLIVKDLRHTLCLRDAHDTLTWAYISPGVEKKLDEIIPGDTLPLEKMKMLLKPGDELMDIESELGKGVPMRNFTRKQLNQMYKASYE